MTDLSPLIAERSVVAGARVWRIAVRMYTSCTSSTGDIHDYGVPINYASTTASQENKIIYQAIRARKPEGYFLTKYFLVSSRSKIPIAKVKGMKMCSTGTP